MRIDCSDKNNYALVVFDDRSSVEVTHWYPEHPDYGYLKDGEGHDFFGSQTCWARRHGDKLIVWEAAGAVAEELA